MPTLPEQQLPGDARLASMLDERLVGSAPIVVVKEEHREEIWAALTGWFVTNEVTATEMAQAGMPVLQTQEAFEVVEAGTLTTRGPGQDESLKSWCSKQAERGRAVFLRGNPLTPERGVMGAYATAYLDVALSAQRPGYMLEPPSGGWKHTSELSEVSAVELAVKNYPAAVVVAAGAAAVGAVTLIYLLFRKRG